MHRWKGLLEQAEGAPPWCSRSYNYKFCHCRRAEPRLLGEEALQHLHVQSEELRRSPIFCSLDDGIAAQLIVILAEGTQLVHGAWCDATGKGQRRQSAATSWTI